MLSFKLIYEHPTGWTWKGSTFLTDAFEKYSTLSSEHFESFKDFAAQKQPH